MEKGTNSRASSGPSYEVFLSFRGVDTRHTFTDFLYHSMIEAGITVFRDSESLHVGKEIGGELLQAIENSKIYIPIFSENYASSSWCLRELAYMVECSSKSNGKKEILPIFLNVEPDDVKLKTNLCRQALAKRQEETLSTEVQSWEKALIAVGKIKGWNWKKDEGQGALIQSIIQTVSVKLKVAYENVTEHLVGVDDRVEAIMERLDVRSDSVQFLGMCGMGGIGKTTLAKVIFNRLLSSFDRCCFLTDVGESSRRNGLVNLQKQLLSKLLDSHSINEIHQVNDGINMFNRGVLCNKKVLLVLDDVDEKEQLQSLAQKVNWFGSGSRIIITTRNKSVLAVEGEVTSEGPANILIYEVQEMEFDHALKLFSRHAFRRDSPPDNRVSLSEKIIRTLGKLPLGLEIIGSFLKGKSKEVWVDTSRKLQKAPPEDVQKKLMVTYERLDHAQREVFLDIACFFINEDSTYPFYMWDACGYCPHEAIEVLILMSLIKIKDNNTFWMHDQVRDLGRDIVRRENREDPAERSRVWNPEEAWSILKGKEGSRKIKALSLGHGQGTLTDDELANLRKLRFFQGNWVSFVGDFNNPFSSLIWLSCHCCSFEVEAKNFHPTKLVVLDLSQSNISDEMIGCIRAAGKLKVLDLSNCRSLTRTPDLSTLVSLERLRLRGCDLIKKLPDSIEKLQSLTELDLSRTNIDHLPDSIGNLKQLTILRMFDVERIRNLPSAIWLLEKLEVLDFRWCLQLTGEIPEEIERLSCLRILNLSWTRISPLPTTMNCLSNLQKLMLAPSAIKRLPELPPNLTCLRWETYRKENSRTRCRNVRFPAQLPSSLRDLRLNDLAIAQSLDFSNLANLSTLGFYSCSMPEFFDIFVPELEELCMQGCKFKRLDALFQLEMKRLKYLRLDECEFLPEVLDLSHMKNLQQVVLHGCKLSVEIRGLEELGSLSWLEVSNCSSIERMSDLSKLRKLEELTVEICPKLRSLEGLNHLISLKRLYISECTSLGSLADTSNLDLESCHIVPVPDGCEWCRRGESVNLWGRIWEHLDPKTRSSSSSSSAHRTSESSELTRIRRMFSRQARHL